MLVKDACPACQSQQCKNNGHIPTGKQHHRGKDCGRPCVLNSEYRVITQDQRTLVARLLLEKSSLHALCRTVGVSIRWLMDFMVARQRRWLTHWVRIGGVTLQKEVDSYALNDYRGPYLPH